MKNIDCYRNSNRKIWLNIASSTYVLEDFVNLDNSIFLYFPKAFARFKSIIPRKYWEAIDLYSEAKKKALLIRHDCRGSLFFPDNSVDHILCSHFLEHVFPVEMERILSDFHRAMKPKATLHLIVPDLKAQAKQYFTDNTNGKSLAADEFVKATMLTRESRGSLKYQLLEMWGAFGLQHRWAYDYLSLAKRVRDAGFNILENNETPSRLFRPTDGNDGSVHVVACKP